MRERAKNTDNGNDYFLGAERVEKKPFTISQPIRKKKVHTIGKLGTGMLRPPKTKLKVDRNQKNIRHYTLNSKSALTDSNTTKQMVKQIEDSIQARIDKAKAAEKEKAQVEKDQEEMKPMNSTLKYSLIAGAFILVIGGIVLIARKKSIKTKTD